MKTSLEVSWLIIKTAITAVFSAFSIAVAAQSASPCVQSLNVHVPSNAKISIVSSPANIEIVGTERDTLSMPCFMDIDTARQVKAVFTRTSTGGKLVLTDPSKDRNVTYYLEVPHRISVKLKMAAGEIRIRQVVGDKDLTVGAGAITVSNDQDSSYKSIDVSTMIGSVEIPATGQLKGGFFRKLRNQKSSGQYRLHAHVTTGQIVLIGVGFRD